MAELNEKPFVIAVVGPTASGKTGLGIRLAKLFDGEIVSVDSMQIYRGMDIATAKPDMDEMQGVPHHMIGVIDPSESFNVAEYVKMATDCIGDILNRGKLPIMVGGTGLYVDSVLDGIDYGEFDIDEARRDELEKIFKNDGGEILLKELEKYDQKLAKSLHANDSARIIRGILVYESTGITLTEHKRRSRENGSPYNYCIIGLGCENRQFLYDKINKRVDIMLEKGLLNETRAFYGMDLSRTSKAAIGYKELYPYISGEKSLDECIDKLKQETRRYAKRQLTWFRRNGKINWINIDNTTSFDEVVQIASAIIKRYGV